MDIKKIILISFLSLTILLAGCSSDVDCSTKDTTYTKYGLNEETGECEVVEELEEDVCGNGVKEDGETYCNCEEDVGKEHPEDGCFGEVGQYLENACSQANQCVVQENSKVTSQTKQLEFRTNDLEIKGEFTLDSPYITSEDLNNAIEMQLQLFSVDQDEKNVKNIKVQSVQFFNRDDVKLAQSNLGQSFSGMGSTLNPESVVLEPLPEREEDISLIVNIPITYTVEHLDREGKVERTEQKIEELRESLGRWTFINPEFIDE